MGILYKKRTKKLQDGGVMMESTPMLYDPNKDGFLATRMREEQLNAAKYKNAYSNLQRQANNKNKNNKDKPDDPEYLEKEYFKSGPKGMRSMYQVGLSQMVSELNAKIAKDPGYIKSKNYINELNNINLYQAEAEADLSSYDKYIKKIEELDNTLFSEVALLNGSFVVENKEKNKLEVVNLLDFLDKAKETYKDKEGDVLLKYRPLTMSEYKTTLEGGVHKNPNDFKRLSEIMSWNNIRKKYIDPVTSKIKSTTTQTNSGKDVEGITLDGLFIANKDIVDVIKSLKSLKSFSYTGNTEKLNEVVEGIAASVGSNSDARDALYRKVMEDEESVKMLAKETDKKKRSELLGNFMYAKIFEEVFLNEDVKYSVEKTAPEEIDPKTALEDYYGHLDSEAKRKLTIAEDIYDVHGERSHSRGTLDPTTSNLGKNDKNKGDGIFSLQYSYHYPKKLQAVLKTAESTIKNSMSKSENKDMASYKGTDLSLYSIPKLDEIIDFDRATIVGAYDPLEVYGKNDMSSLLQSSYFTDISEIKSALIAVDKNGYIDKKQYAFIDELDKTINTLIDNGTIYDEDDPLSMGKLRTNALNYILKSSKNKEAVEYLKSLVGDVDEIPTNLKNSPLELKSFSGQRVLIFDIIGQTPEDAEENVQAKNLLTGKKENLEDNGVILNAENASERGKEDYFENKSLQFIDTNKIAKENTGSLEGGGLYPGDYDFLISTMVVPAHEIQLGMHYDVAEYGSIIDKIGRTSYSKSEYTFKELIDDNIKRVYADRKEKQKNKK